MSNSLDQLFDQFYKGILSTVECNDNSGNQNNNANDNLYVFKWP